MIPGDIHPLMSKCTEPNYFVTVKLTRKESEKEKISEGTTDQD